MKYILLLFSIQIFCGEFGASIISVTSMLNFVNELLRNNSDSQIPYLAKIHALFCPDQPICSVDDSHENNSTISRLNTVLNFSYITTGIEQIKSAVGICCFTCSCSETCREYNYCCPTKYFINKIPTENPTKRDCIAATSKSYKTNSGIGNQYLSYFMVTHCFLDTTNQTILSKCENPVSVNFDESTPVTSVLTGQTYWNEYCALCNNDADSILPWNSTASFVEDIVYYSNISGGFIYPQSLERLLGLLDGVGNIVYTPPLPMDHDQCLLDANRKLHLTCGRGQNTSESEERLLIIEACEKLYNPVYVHLRMFVYRNIFCFLCLEEEMHNVPQVECRRQFDGKFKGGQMTALLNYKSKDDVDITAYNKGKREKCPCDSIYDHYQDLCRPIFCPPGEFLSACRCKQPISSLSGMPLLLKLKVFPEPGKYFPTTENQIRKLHKALQKTIQTTTEQITAEIIATFQQEKAITPYHLYVLIVRTKPGYDTKETMKPFLNYFENRKHFKVKSSKTTFLVILTNTVLFWTEQITGMDGKLVAIFRAKEIEGDHPLTKTYTKQDIIKTVTGKGHYQVFSPLLYCMQVQLEENEFSEKDGMITLNISTSSVSLLDYYRVSNSQARVCADQYLQQSTDLGNKLIFAFDPLGLVCMLTFVNLI